jgi:hypothetical protein
MYIYLELQHLKNMRDKHGNTTILSQSTVNMIQCIRSYYLALTFHCVLEVAILYPLLHFVPRRGSAMLHFSVERPLLQVVLPLPPEVAQKALPPARRDGVQLMRQVPARSLQCHSPGVEGPPRQGKPGGSADEIV